MSDEVACWHTFYVQLGSGACQPQTQKRPAIAMIAGRSTRKVCLQVGLWFHGREHHHVVLSDNVEVEDVLVVNRYLDA